MKNFTFLFTFLLFFAFCEQTFAQGGGGIVTSCGRLKVASGHVCTETGDQVSLAGMSMFWSGWASKYYTAATVNYLVDNLKVSIVRAAYGVPAGSGPQGNVQDIKNIVEACIAKDIYVIIDWHIEGDNTAYESQEISFFESMVQLYGQNKHVIYELWNEPTTTPTETIKNLCQRVANAIRKKENDNGFGHNLIICGSQTWSQNPNSYSIDDPNAAYTFHGYFDNQPGHYSQLTNNAKAAMDKGNAVFVTEYGADYCNHASTEKAIAWCQENKISMCAWSVNDKVEPWSIFTNNMDALTCVGTYYKSKMIVWPSPIAAKTYPTAISITPTTISLATIGASFELSPSFTPVNTNQTKVSWSSSNSAVVSVDANGLISGLAAGTETITVTAMDMNTVSISGTCVVTVQNLVNLALNKPTTFSSKEADDKAGGSAVDGKAGSRWSSLFTDPQWLQIDLGASYNISGALISWEAASAKDYTIQISQDGNNWTTIATKTGLTTGLRTDNLSLTGTGRYVKMNGTARNTVYGYSIYEIEIYGTVGELVHPTSFSISPASSTIKAGFTAQLTSNFLPITTSNQSVSWASSNSDVASISNTGLVSALAAGNTTITATSVDGNLVANATISVTPATALNGVDKSAAIEANIYPNPTNGQEVKLKLNGLADGLVNVLILNTDGQVLQQNQFLNLGAENTATLNISQLPAGLYIVNIKTKHISKQVKLVIGQ